MDRMLRSTDLWIGAGLVLLVTAVFGQAIGFELTSWDDTIYISENRAVQAGLSPRSIGWALTAVHHGTWQPLTWISFMADVELARLVARALGARPGALDAAVHHGVNVLLHAANTCLLFGVLLQATRRRWESAFVAALFAVHPLHVESVAWVTERKDVLSTLFWFLTMLAHQRFARAPGRRAQLAVAGAFALGLAAKPMLVTLPLVLLMWDFWPLRRLEPATLRDRIAEKAPLFALSAASCALALWAHLVSGGLGKIESYPLDVRVASAALAYVTYLGKAICPSGISFFYPHPRTALPIAQAIPAGLALAIVTALALRAARSRPYVAVGWLWYGIALLPVSGLVQFGIQAARADRFTYVPLVGIFLMVAWGVPDWVGSWRRVPVRWRVALLGATGGAVVLGLSAAAYPVVGHWRDSETLYRQALRVDPRNFAAHNNLASLLLDRGQIEEGISHLEAALEAYPEYSKARFNLAAAMERQGKILSAIAEYERLLAHDPNDALAHNNLGTLLARIGRFDEAIAHFEAADRLRPGYPTILGNLESARRARDAR